MSTATSRRTLPRAASEAAVSRSRSPAARARKGGRGAPISRPAQIRALVAPARQEIVDVLESAGPCPVARIAELVGRPADALYHHLRRLQRVGLVAETERRQVGRHVFAVYDLAVRPLNVRYDGPAGAGDVARVMASAQRLSWRHFRAALHRGEAVLEGPRRTLWGARAHGWLTPAELERVNGLLGELLAALRGGRPGKGSVPVSVSFLLAPIPKSRRARAARTPTMHDKSGRTPRRKAPQKKGHRS